MQIGDAIRAEIRRRVELAERRKRKAKTSLRDVAAVIGCTHQALETWLNEDRVPHEYWCAGIGKFLKKKAADVAAMRTADAETRKRRRKAVARG